MYHMYEQGHPNFHSRLKTHTMNEMKNVRDSVSIKNILKSIMHTHMSYALNIMQKLKWNRTQLDNI